MKKILLIFCFLLSSCASPSATSDSDALNLKHSNLPNGIYYNGHIYWEIYIGKKDNIQGNSLGTLHEVEQKNCFPVSNLVGTADLKKFIGSQIYSKENRLYLENDNKVYVFQYIYKSKQKREEIVSAEDFQDTEYTIPPHFVYNDMMFSTFQSEDIKLPTNFKEVGKIEKLYVRSNTNYAGNIPINSILYANEIQNRFMIVKNSEDNKYYVFENEAYNNVN